MLKVYLKGFESPYAVFGYKLFEDERHLVLVLGQSEFRIPHKNIAFIETVLNQPVEFSEPEHPEHSSAPPAQPKMSRPSDEFLAAKIDEAIIAAKGKSEAFPNMPDAKKTIMINFAGHKTQTFALDVPEAVLTGSYNPQLSKEIFSNPQIKAFTGDFVISGVPTVDGNNIIIQTSPLQASPQAPLASQMSDVKAKLDITKNFLASVSSAAPKINNPSLKLDNSFSMSGSPFSTPVSLQDDDE